MKCFGCICSYTVVSTEVGFAHLHLLHSPLQAHCMPSRPLVWLSKQAPMTLQLDSWTKRIHWETEPLDVPECWSSIFQLGILHVVCDGEAHSVLVI